MPCNCFLAGYRPQAANCTPVGALEAGLGFGFLGDMPDNWHPLCSRHLAGSAAVGLVLETFCLEMVEFEVAPWDQGCGRCLTTLAVRSCIGVSPSVQGTSGLEMEDRKIAGRGVGYCVAPDGDDGDVLAVLGPEADDSKQMSPTKETAGKKEAADLSLAESGRAVVLMIAGIPTLSTL